MKKVYIFEQGCYAVLKDTTISFVFDYLLEFRAMVFHGHFIFDSVIQDTQNNILNHQY